MAAGAGASSPAPRRPPAARPGRSGALAIRSQGHLLRQHHAGASRRWSTSSALQAPFTGGEDGIQAVPRGRRPGRARPAPARYTLYFVVLAIFLLGLPRRLPGHPLAASGRCSRPSARTSRGRSRWATRAEQYKLMAFVLSATLAGLAGGTKALVFQLASLTDVHWTMSGEVVLMTPAGRPRHGVRSRRGRASS